MAAVHGGSVRSPPLHCLVHFLVLGWARAFHQSVRILGRSAFATQCSLVSRTSASPRSFRHSCSSTRMVVSESNDDATSSPSTDTLKAELLDLGVRTKRGFKATNDERKRARQLIFALAEANPTNEPAWSFYSRNEDSATKNSVSIAGNWNLVYTDAPDITGLDGNLFSELGRIGQNCCAPYIKNIIEWNQPSWAAGLPGTGGSQSNPRVLQKVVCQAKASPSQPTMVDLELAGIQVESGNSPLTESSKNLLTAIEQNGLVSGILLTSPIDLNGPVNTPFGKFEVLYLDNELRINQTGQNYVAVNMRVKDGEDWF